MFKHDAFDSVMLQANFQRSREKAEPKNKRAACSHTLLVRGFRLTPGEIYDAELNDITDGYAWQCPT